MNRAEILILVLLFISQTLQLNFSLVITSTWKLKFASSPLAIRLIGKLYRICRFGLFSFFRSPLSSSMHYLFRKCISKMHYEYTLADKKQRNNYLFSIFSCVYFLRSLPIIQTTFRRQIHINLVCLNGVCCS